MGIDMAAVLLSILKIIGIILLSLLGVLLVLLLLVLFVPVRYRLKALRSPEDTVAVQVSARVTWLLHAISVSFRYPEKEYLKVRVLGIPVFRAGTQTGADTEREEKKTEERKETEATGEAAKTETTKTETTKTEAVKKAADTEAEDKKARKTQTEEASQETKKTGILNFFHKIWTALKNIKYTIQKICDKIKHIVRNIRYYSRVVQSDSFQRAWKLCRGEVFSLVRSILPKKLTGNITVGTGDPASTAQILAVHGILYPLIGNHIFITPDFENSVLEGDFYMKGRITVFKVLKTAARIYFSKDLRRVIRLLKREAA